MNVNRCWDQYALTTGSASNASRQLGFAGIALIWVLSGDEHEIKGRLLIGGVLIVISLALDLVQYMVAGARWFDLVKDREREFYNNLSSSMLSNERQELIRGFNSWEFDTPSYFHFVPRCCYWAKLFVMFGAYGCILSNLALQILEGRGI